MTRSHQFKIELLLRFTLFTVNSCNCRPNGGPFPQETAPSDGTYCGLQLTFFSSGLRLGSGASRGLGGSRFLSCSRLTGRSASTSSSGTPLRPPSAADSCERLGNVCRGETDEIFKRDGVELNSSSTAPPLHQDQYKNTNKTYKYKSFSTLRTLTPRKLNILEKEE